MGKKYQPEKLLDIFLDRQTPATVDDFFEFAKQSHPEISERTIYIQKDTLIEQGMLKSLGGRPEEFVLPEPHDIADHLREMKDLAEEAVTSYHLTHRHRAVRINEFLHLFFSGGEVGEVPNKIDELGKKIADALQEFEAQTGCRPGSLFYSKSFFDINKYLEDFLERKYGPVADNLKYLCLANSIRKIIHCQINRMEEKIEWLTNMKENSLKEMREQLEGNLGSMPGDKDIKKMRTRGICNLIDEEIETYKELIDWMKNADKKIQIIRGQCSRRAYPDASNPHIRLAFMSSWLTTAMLQVTNQYFNVSREDMEKAIEEATMETMKRHGESRSGMWYLKN